MKHIKLFDSVQGEKKYSAYIVTGPDNDRRESGSYTCYGEDFRSAAADFGKRWNTNARSSTYGDEWEETGTKENMPKDHMYLKDDKGNRLLLIERR